MAKYYLFFIACLWSLGSGANHIVGGEITLQYLPNYRYGYRVTLNLYYDLLNSKGLAAQDPYVRVGFFDKATNILLDTLDIPFIFPSDSTAQSSICRYIKLSTRHIVYYADVILPPSRYNGPQGFYVAWERCCRNVTVTNIVNPGFAATTFYSEFPPIDTYHDSSPEFSSPVNNGYACQGIPFTYNFSATDQDNDQLVYELETPYNGHSVWNFPRELPKAAPYSYVNYFSGFSLQNIIPGTPPLSINSVTGILSMTPKLAGLYVFTVKCSEYRNGVYLGSVRRDYQLWVIACGRENTKPILAAVDPVTNQQEVKKYTLSIDNRFASCLTLLAIDTAQGQQLTISTTSFNFTNFNSVTTISPNFYFTKTSNDTAHIALCIAPCININNAGPSIQFILKNENNCTQPKYDTIVVTIQNTAPKIPPVVSTDLPSGEVSVLAGHSLAFNVYATNDGIDGLSLSGSGNGFRLSDRRMSFPAVHGTGTITSGFSFTPVCQDLTASPFTLQFTAQDSSCFAKTYGTSDVQIRVRDTTVNRDFPLVTVFTPNGDGTNDVFEIPGLPADNCTEQFTKIEIYNRWGTRLYTTTDRGFKWMASGVPDGLYYYIIQYSTIVYKSWLELLR